MADVKLVVRARNEATKTLDSITGAIEKLVGGQAKLAGGAESAGGALASLAKETAGLIGKFDGANTFGKMADDLKEATAEFKRQDDAVKETKAQLAAYQTQLAGAAAAQSRLADEQKKAAAAVTEQRKTLKGAETDLRNLEKTIDTTSSKKFAFPTVKSIVDLPALRSNLDAARQELQTRLSVKDALAGEANAVNAEYRKLDSAVRSIRSGLDGQEQSVRANSAALQGLAIATGAAEDAYKKLNAEQATAAARNAQLAAVPVRRAAVETRTIGQGALDSVVGARDGARAELEAISKAALAAGPPTRAVAANLAALQTASAATRTATSELATAMTTLTNESRSSSATADSLKAAIAGVQNATQKAAESVRTLGSTLAAQGAMARQAATATQAGVAATNQQAEAQARNAAGQKAVTEAVKEYNDGARRSLDLSQRIRGQVLSLTAAYLGLQNAIAQIGQVVAAYQSMEAAQNRLGAVFDGDQSKVATELDFIRRNADRLGISFDTLAGEYGKFAIATKGTNLEGEETRKIFLAVAEAGRVNKLSVEQMQGTYNALTQMVSKGKVQAEELRQQLGDRLPGAFNIMAAALGKTTAQLDDAMSRGEITSEALSKFADELNKRFGKQLSASLESTTTAIGQFQNQLYQTRLEFANGGFIDAFTEGLRSLTKEMKSPEFQDFIAKLSSGLASLIRLLIQIPDHARALTIAFAAFIGLKVAGSVAAVTASFRLLGPQIVAAGTAAEVMALRANSSRTAILGAAVATRSWGAALALLGGPIGIAITAISIGIGYWATRTDTATAALNDHNKMIDAVKNGYDKAGKSADDWRKQIVGATLAQATANLASLKLEFDKLAGSMQASSMRFTRMALDGTQTVANPDPKVKEQVESVIELLNAFRQRRLTLDEFKKQIDLINRSAANDAIKGWTLGLLNTADMARETSDALTGAANVVKVLGGTAEDAADAMKSINGEASGVAAKIDESAANLKKFGEVAAKVNLGVPGAVGDGKRTKEIEDLQKDLGPLLNLNAPANGISDLFGLEPKKLADAISGYLRQGIVPADVATLISNRMKAIEAEYTKSLLAGIPEISKGYTERLIQIESGGDATAKNKRSTAAGLGQFTNGTWVEQFTKVFPEAAAKMNEAAILQYKTGEQFRDTQLKVLENFTKENLAYLAKNGVGPSSTNAYLAHFLGKGDAVKVLLANPATDLAKLVTPDSRKSNPEVFAANKTAADLVAWAAKKMGGGAALLPTGATQKEADTEAAQKKDDAELEARYQKSVSEDTAYRDHLETTQIRINKELDERYNKMKLTATEAEIENTLTEAGLTLQNAAGRAIAEKITRNRESVDLEEKINALMVQRNALQADIQFQQDQGNFDAAAGLTTQLQGVNGELVKAANNSIAFWQSFGGPNAAGAIAGLEAMKRTVQTGLEKPLINVEQIMQSISSAGTTAFSSAAEALYKLASGSASLGDTIHSLGAAFRTFTAEVLSGIAKMIVQQIIYNALLSFAKSMGYGGAGGAGAGAATTAASVLHTGGIAGRPGASRSIGMSAFIGATRYHTGGIAGQPALADNEIPAILKPEEEVLTRNDPRHSFNGGGVAQQPVNVKVINTIDPADMVSQGLNTAVGEKAVFNMISANKTRFKALLS